MSTRRRRSARPPVPSGWTIVEEDSGRLRLALPPDIIAFDTSNAVFANQPPPAGGGDWIQLLAEGPGTAIPQPDSDEPLERWLERRWLAGEPSRGGTLVRTVDLAAGHALELGTTLAPGTSDERRVILYAIRTSMGVGFLAIDGPPSQMQSHRSDLALIPLTMDIGPGWRSHD